MKTQIRRSGAYVWPMVMLVLMLATAASAQGQAKFSVQFEGTPLSKVLEALKRFDPSFSYTLPQGAENRLITASLVDVTVGEALAIVLEQANMRFVRDNNTYAIREKTAAATTRAERPMPQYGAPIFTTRPASPAAAQATSAQPAMGSAGGPGGEGMTEVDPRANLPIRLVRVKYANPGLIAELFGGYTIYGDESSQMSGGGGSGSRGGIGGRGGGFGSSGSRGGFGSRSGSSSGRSNIGSSRSSSSSRSSRSSTSRSRR
jgi:hypothetical protein